jgi:hypothetical protein
MIRHGIFLIHSHAKKSLSKTYCPTCRLPRRGTHISNHTQIIKVEVQVIATTIEGNGGSFTATVVVVAVVVVVLATMWVSPTEYEYEYDYDYECGFPMIKT